MGYYEEDTWIAYLGFYKQIGQVHIRHANTRSELFFPLRAPGEFQILAQTAIAQATVLVRREPKQ